MSLFPGAEPQPNYPQPQQQFESWPPPAPPAPPRATPWRGIIASLIIFAVLTTGGVVAWVQRENIRDLVTVWNYEPTSDIVGYIERSRMSDRGEFLFKASQPVVQAGDDFNETCAAEEEGTGVLGCYLPATRTILLFDVTDERLDGIEEVVAAHEMLHAAWDRMSVGERDSLAPLLEAEAASREDDKDFAERMAVYERVEPGERLNELHSIVGTELEEISPALEKHYAEFFSDRATVVALHVTSNGVFVELEKKTAALIAEMDDLREGVEADYKKYNSGFDKLNNDVDAFNAKANRPGGFATQYQFDQERAALMARQDSLESLYASIDKRADLYDSKLEELKKLNAQAAELNVGINVTPRDDTIG